MSSKRKKQDAPSEEPESPKAAPSKAAIVREALSEGLQSPSEIAAWAKARYDVEVTPQMVSAYKSHDKAKSNGTRKGVKRINPGIDLDAVRKVKELVDSIGADEVAELVEVFR